MSPENIISVYIPKIFKDRIKFKHPKIKFVDMEAKVFSSSLYNSNVKKFGKPWFLGLIEFDDDFDNELNYEKCDDDMLKLFAKTARIEYSSAGNGYFRGTFPNGEVFDLDYIHYDI